MTVPCDGIEGLTLARGGVGVAYNLVRLRHDDRLLRQPVIRHALRRAARAPQEAYSLLEVEPHQACELRARSGGLLRSLGAELDRGDGGGVDDRRHHQA